MEASTPAAGRSPDLSVVIPVHNAADKIGALVTDLASGSGLDLQVITVDDASTDDSVRTLRELGHSAVQVVELGQNHGAGFARNHGFASARGRYTLFFDADDEIEVGALSAAVEQLDHSGADVAFLPYRYRRGFQPGVLSMNHFDRAVWGEYVPRSGRRVVTLREVPRLLGFSNYPWNKVVRTDHYHDVGLRFGETHVHNDILGHWMTMLNARSVLLLDQVVGTHIVGEDGTNLSHQHDCRRLQLFDALAETYEILAGRPGLRARYAHHYWDFVLRVSDWAMSRLDADLREDAAARLQQHLLRMNLTDLTHMRLRRNPALADLVLRRSLA